MSKVAMIFPTLNEAAAIHRLLCEADAVRVMLPEDTDIIVSDSGSTDETCTIVEAFAKQVRGVYLWHSVRGKGNNMRSAFQRAIDAGYDYITMLDGDGTYSPVHLAPMLYYLMPPELRTIPVKQVMGKHAAIQYDAVCGTRKYRERGAMSRVHLLGNTGLTILADLLYWPTFIGDLCTGMWAFRAETLQKLNLTAQRFELEADMFVALANAGMKLYSGPILYRARADGDKPKLHTLDGLRIARHLIKRRFTCTPK